MSSLQLACPRSQWFRFGHSARGGVLRGGVGLHQSQLKDLWTLLNTPSCFPTPAGGEVVKGEPHTWVNPNPLIPFCPPLRYTKSKHISDTGRSREKWGYRRNDCPDWQEHLYCFNLAWYLQMPLPTNAAPTKLYERRKIQWTIWGEACQQFRSKKVGSDGFKISTSKNVLLTLQNCYSST